MTSRSLVTLPDILRHRINQAEAAGVDESAQIATVAEVRELLGYYDRATEAVDTNQVRVAMLRGFAGQAVGLIEQAKTLLGRDVGGSEEHGPSTRGATL